MAEPFTSPTVKLAYEQDPDWWDDFGGRRNRRYDFDGYDRHGFDSAGFDRAGWTAADYADPRTARRCQASAEVAAASLASAMARRMPGKISQAIVDRTAAMLSERFPGIPRWESPVTGDGSEDLEAAIFTGVNATRNEYAGVYFIRRCLYFSVIAEYRTREAGEEGWSGTVLRNDGCEPVEKPLSGMESLDALMLAVAAELESFRPLAERHAVFLRGAGTADASFGAMHEEEWSALPEGHRPGERIATVPGETAEEALRAFAAAEARSAGFMEMVERGLASAEEASPSRIL